MKTSHILLIILLATVYACHPKKGNKAVGTETTSDSLVPLQVTVIADLPDSLQPKSFALDTMKKPEVIRAGKGITKMLPVLENEKGEPILDAHGEPFLMGDGGISHFTNFSMDDGLALDVVLSTIIDKGGNLWFGTNGGGVCRYDGKSFITFTNAQGLANNFINAIEEDAGGNIWFGTNGGGVCRYDGKSFITFTDAQGLANNFINAIEEDARGNIWFATMGGVCKYDGKSFSRFTTAEELANNDVTSIAEDKNGNLWFGTYAGGVSRYDGRSFSRFTTAEGLANNDVMSIAADKNGNLWFGTNGGGVSRFDGISFTNFNTSHGLPNNYVRKIHEDKNGNLWMGTVNGGLCRYDGKTFTVFTTAEGLANNDVWSIVEDKSGYLWTGTFGGGVSRYEGKAFSTFTTAQGLPDNMIWNILEDKSGNLWFGSDDGICRYDGKSFTSYTINLGPGKHTVYSSMKDNRGNLWFSIRRIGFLRFDGKTFTKFSKDQGLPSNTAMDMLEDDDGNIWFCTMGDGICRFDGNAMTTFTTSQGLAHNYTLSMSKDKSGNLWIGTLGGLTRYDGHTFTNFTTDDGLALNSINSCFMDTSGNLWLGTDGGGVSRIMRHDLEKFKSNANTGPLKRKQLFENFTSAQGLASDVVLDITADKNGNIIIGTLLGFTLIPANVNALPFSEIKNEIEYYNSAHGFPVKDVNTGALFCDSKGMIWSGTGSNKTALVRFDYSAIQKNTLPPNVVIQAVNVNNQNICWYDLVSGKDKSIKPDSSTTLLQQFLAYGRKLSVFERDSISKQFKKIEFTGISKFNPVPQNLVLPYEHNQISFEFAAIETSRPYLVKYQYILEGYNKDWSSVTDKSSATFGNISEGTYTFRLKAQGANGVWSQPVEYTFTVLPPWYRSWWAYGLYTLLTLPVLWFIHKNQQAKTIRKEREKIRERELAQAKEIEKAYTELGKAHDQLKSTQAQLIQSEKMASLGELTAGIAHEIQNPLNFVNNFSEVSNELIAEVLEERKKPAVNRDEMLEEEILGDIKENLTKINLHGKRASDIVKGMLEHSRKSTGEKEQTDINALCDEYFKLAYHGLRAKDKDFHAVMETHFDPYIPKINMVAQDIGRVMLNLISNAFYAVNERKKTGEPGYEPKVSLTTVRTAANQIRISVKDNGPGIPDHIREKIFQPFFTTKPAGQGTGLGLSLSYDIVKAHGGELIMETNRGEGSTFTIQIPVS